MKICSRHIPVEYWDAFSITMFFLSLARPSKMLPACDRLKSPKTYLNKPTKGGLNENYRNAASLCHPATSNRLFAGKLLNQTP